MLRDLVRVDEPGEEVAGGVGHVDVQERGDPAGFADRILAEALERRLAVAECPQVDGPRPIHSPVAAADHQLDEARRELLGRFVGALLER